MADDEAIEYGPDSLTVFIVHAFNGLEVGLELIIGLCVRSEYEFIGTDAKGECKISDDIKCGLGRACFVTAVLDHMDTDTVSHLGFG